jgi:tRNA pseudouridine32 synthase/23S rRNA pseudouridine746 synthase
VQIDAVLEVEAGDPQIAIDFLVANINLSKSRLKDLMNKGGVWRVTNEGERSRIRRAMTDIRVGEQIEIFYDETLLSLKPVKPDLIEDLGQYSLWNKPQGMSFAGSDWGDFNSFVRSVELYTKGEREMFLFQAFDYDASGVMLVAHSRKAAASLSEQFAETGFTRGKLHYRADVQGDFEGGDTLAMELEEGLAKAKVAKVRYDERPNRSVIDIWPLTGLEHQVRRQLSHAGFPVVGEDLYTDEETETELLRLKCIEVEFECPVKGDIQHVSLIK